MDLTTGQNLIKQKKFPAALKLFKNLLTLNPNKYDIYFYLGRVYSELQDFESGIKFYKKYLEKNKNSIGCILNLAILYLNIGDKKNSENNFRRLLGINRSYIYAYYGLFSLSENHLKEEDLNSMFHSIENRTPFLDSNLFQTGLNMPSKLYIKNGFSKWPLRQIIKGIVPEKIRLNKRKTGFNASIKDIIRFDKKTLNYLTKDNEIFDIINKKKFTKLLENRKEFTGVQNNFIFNFLSVKLFFENLE